jgi:hypothetical protein
VLLVLRDVLLIRPNAGRDGVGPADPLKLGGDVAVIQAGIVATVAADDLERVGVSAFWLAGDDPDWLAPQNAPGLIKGPHACSLRSTSLDTSRRCNARRPLARVKGPGQPSGRLSPSSARTLGGADSSHGRAATVPQPAPQTLQADERGLSALPWVALQWEDSRQQGYVMASVNRGDVKPASSPAWEVTPR